MTDQVMNTKLLPEILFQLIQTEKVRLRETDGIIQIIPINETFDCTKGLRGMFANCPDMSVDSFLERKHNDKNLDR
ncbi:MAG: hypothetical protein LBB88_09890 [Planctomycetaceae bacterium]|jgi:hypothetical protein|nr:hypothetical protein [Planctomycetaceae bacterium]